MAEPTSSAALAATVATSITLASFTGLDTPTLIGASAGASLFVMSAKDLGVLVRLVYLAISLVMGYLAGPAFLKQWISEPSLAAFIFSSCVIVVGLRVIRAADEFNFKSLFRKGP